jgi:hypothetical protein
LFFLSFSWLILFFNFTLIVLSHLILIIDLVSWFRSWVSKESLIWRFILGSFFNWFFYFNHSTLSYYAFSFMIFITFFFIGLSWFHISSCRLVKLTRTFSNVFLLVFSSFFHFIVLFFFFCMRLSQCHNQAINLAYWLELVFFLF